MNPLEFIFMLLQRYASIPPQKVEYLRSQAFQWYQSKEVEDNKIAKYIKEKGEMWYVQLGLAVLFIFAVRWVHDFMNPSASDDDRDGI